MTSTKGDKWWLNTTRQTRSEVWDGYRSAAFASQYYQMLGNRFLRWHKSLSISTILLGGGAALPSALLAILQNGSDQLVLYAMAFAGVSLSVIAAFNIVLDPAKKSAVSFQIAKSCGNIVQEYADLMSAIDRNVVDDDEARRRLGELLKTVGDETCISDPAGITVSQTGSLNRRAAKSAYQRLEIVHARA